MHLHCALHGASRLHYLAGQLQLEVTLSPEDSAALAEGAEAFLEMDVGNNKDKLRLAAARASGAGAGAGDGSGGGSGGGLGSGRSKFEVLENELDKERRKVDKKARRQAEREAQDSREVATQQEAEEAAREQRRHGVREMTTGEVQQVRRYEARRAAEQQAPDEEDGEALELELAQTHTTAKARPKGGGARREKAVSEKELREMSAKQLKRLLEREKITVPNDVRQGRTASGDHELALRNFALEVLVRPEKEQKKEQKKKEEAEDALLEAAVAQAAAEKEQKRREEGSGLGGMAAGIARRVGDAFTFGKATTAAAAAAAGAAAAEDGGGGGAGDGDGSARSSGKVEAQGAGGAAGTEAERQQARKRELRAKLKEKQEILRGGVDLQALVIVVCLASVHPTSMSGFGAAQHREMVLVARSNFPPCRTTYYRRSRTRPRRSRAKGRRSRARERPPSARSLRIRWLRTSGSSSSVRRLRGQRRSTEAYFLSSDLCTRGLRGTFYVHSHTVQYIPLKILARTIPNANRVIISQPFQASLRGPRARRSLTATTAAVQRVHRQTPRAAA